MFIPQHTPATSQMLAVIHRILYNDFGGELRTHYLEAKVFELILLGLRQSSGISPLSYRLALAPAEKERLQEARAYLLENITTPLSIQALSSQVGMSESRLREGFRQQYGLTPFDFIWEARMERARQLLLTSNISIQEIATMVGYSQVAGFSTAFTKGFGYPPGLYRRRR